MIRIVALLLAPVITAGAADQNKPAKKSSPPAAEQAKAAIPPDAKEIEPGLYRWKDPQGKTWILRKSPFGVLKSEERPPSAQAPDELPPGLTVTEEGDELRFERPTPFGPTRWKKKKTELNEMEQRAWQREQSKKAAQSPKE
jgi:hypothetical protein